MTKLFKAAALAALLTSGAVCSLASPAMAQDSGPVVPGLGVVNFEAVVANSNAFKAAQQQRQVTYKPQIDQAQARENALEAQLKPLADKFNKDRAAPGANPVALQQQVQVIQGIQQSGQQEIQRIVQPFTYSQAYGTEQIEAKLDAAVGAAMAKRKISLVLYPQAVAKVSNGAYDLTQDVLAEVNTLIPSVQITPPAGWVPREIREQQQQQGGSAPAPANQSQGR